VAEGRHVWLRRLIDGIDRVSEDLRARGGPHHERMLAELRDLRARLEAELRGANQEPQNG
jgi:hypothetical protein